jgi:hypothetical protein
MSDNRRRVAAGIVVPSLLVVAFLSVTYWAGEPARTTAKPTPVAIRAQLADPAISVIFVIDSSMSMFPRYGPSYFDLARDGLVALLSRPGFPDDGTVQMGVIQYTKIGSREYMEDVHYLPLTRIGQGFGRSREETADLLRQLEPSLHPSASLMEMGLAEAASLLSSATSSSNRHIVLLSTGEYRIPRDPTNILSKPPCDYAVAEEPGSVCTGELGTCDSVTTADSFYNRACFIREFARRAREAECVVSTLRFAPDWRNARGPDEDYGESATPYGAAPNYCIEPVQPDRGGFLKELANWASDAGNPCVPPVAGRSARINPFFCFNCGIDDWRPGTAKDVADGLAKWICEWAGAELQDDDHDEVCDLTDDCPAYSDPLQLDCNRDGVADACQLNDHQVCPLDANSQNDLDGDGVCDALDTCQDGDDCKVAEWAEVERCPAGQDLADCGPDCDHWDGPDLCQAAQSCPVPAPVDCYPVPHVI